MEMSQRWKMILLALTLGPFSFVAQLEADEKLKIESFVSALQGSDSLLEVYKASLSGQEESLAQAEKRERLIKQNTALLNSLEAEFLRSKSFERGRIEDEKNMNGLTMLLQLDLLRLRAFAKNQDWKLAQRVLEAWFQFAADFPYEESSLVGLRYSGVVRSLLLDAMESLLTQYKLPLAQVAEFRKWFLQVRAPWPVDRVVLSEAQRVLKGPYHSMAETVAKAYQKNPYQSAAVSLKSVKGKDSEGAKALKEFWRDSDIQSLKLEITRISKLKLRLAMAEYELQKKKRPASAQELVKSGLLDKVPLDYFTGRPLDLTSL